MDLTFRDVVDEAAGPVAKTAAWGAEIRGLMRFALREHAQRLGVWIDRALPWMGRHRPRIGSEFRWAGRGFLGRGWRAVMVVALLGVAFAANTVVFSAADSFLLRPSPYPHPERLVAIGRGAGSVWSAYGSPDTIPAWRSFTDTFSQVLAYDREYSAFVTSGDQGPHGVAAVQVEPGLLELLGARLVAGRFFAPTDRPMIIGKNGMGWNRFAPTLSIISETLARQEFGGASQAIGRTFAVDKHPTTVVGVLAAGFRFPTGAEQVWTPLDVSLINVGHGIEFLEQLAPGVTFERAAAVVRERDASVQSRRGAVYYERSVKEPASLRRLGENQDAKMQKIVWLLAGAAGCLLLIACANVVNLELAAAIPRARNSAIAIALGASPASLLGTSLLEGAIGILLSAALGAALAWQAAASLTALLPASVSSTLANPIDVDARAVAFMTLVAGLAWLVTTLPVAFVALRTDVVDALRLDTRSSAGSAGSTMVRRLLTSAEVALSVLLLVGALLSSRSYSSLLSIPKGFNVSGVVAVDIVQQPGASDKPEAVEERTLNALRTAPFVSYAAEAMGIPPGSGGAVTSTLSVNGQERAERPTASLYGVDPQFFQAMALPIVEGRSFTAADAPGAIVVDEGFARKYWPGGSAIGSVINFRNISIAGTGSKYTIVGVASHMRNSRDTPTGVSADAFPLYYRLSEFVSLTYVVRLNDEKRLDDLKALLKGLTPTSRVRAEFVRDSYAKAYANELIAASIMRTFGALALVVAVTGIYSVMAYMVSGRTREIGLRMALGADGRAITGMVLSSSLSMVLAGATIGVVDALIAARWGSSLLFGVSARDPWIYASVAVVVIVTAVIATWRPALVASRVDPSRLLRD